MERALQTPAGMTPRLLVVIALHALAAPNSGCARDDANAAPAPASRTAPPPSEESAPPATAEEPRAAPTSGAGGHRHKAVDENWVPAEFQKGASRWKDTGVYVDGKPVGFLTFGELPIALTPVFVDEEISIPIKPGQKGPHYKLIQQRYYRFTDYLKYLGVDVSRIRELHVYGPKFTDTIVVSGAELRKRGKDFLFRFGGDVCGKAIPRVPDDFGNGKSPDKVSTVIAYIDKQPPELVRNRGLVLDGNVIQDIPYYGEPLRGGIRVYRDDRFAGVIKRRQLAVEKSGNQDAANPIWKLSSFLEQEGVDVSQVAEAWIIHRDERVLRLDGDELRAVTFQANAQRHGEILVGPNKTPANVIALHSRSVRNRLPKLLPHEHCATIAGGN